LTLFYAILLLPYCFAVEMSNCLGVFWNFYVLVATSFIFIFLFKTLECDHMVKFQVYWVKKVCKGRGLCRYRGVLLRLPKKFHPRLEPFIGIELNVKDITIRTVGNQKTIDIILTT